MQTTHDEVTVSVEQNFIDSLATQSSPERWKKTSCDATEEVYFFPRYRLHVMTGDWMVAQPHAK